MIASHHKVSLNIDVTPESAWEIIGGVSGVDNWLAPISACRVEGSKRYCTAEGKEFSEDILSVDHEHKVLRYAIPEQHLLPVQEIIGEMNVRKTGTGTAIVDWEWEFQVEPANESEAKEQLDMIGKMGIQGIEALIKNSKQPVA
ncbi:MAG: SRPBCC family protein [Bacteroidota bacterium]